MLFPNNVRFLNKFPDFRIRFLASALLVGALLLFFPKRFWPATHLIGIILSLSFFHLCGSLMESGELAETPIE